MNHNLRRTNPKGERGLFKCLNCEQWGHIEKFDTWDCPAPGDEEIELLQAIEKVSGLRKTPDRNGEKEG